MNKPCDINCDLGEDPARLSDGSDAALLALVSSCNIACGGHAGDEATMSATIQLALGHNVAIGAHPSYPDTPNFGRVDQHHHTPSAIEEFVFQQIHTLSLIARDQGATLTHLKPHGALYHAAMTRPKVAEAVARAASRLSPDLILVGQAGAPALEQWRSLGFEVAPEAFADRTYEPDGRLRPRTQPGAIITSVDHASTQALAIAAGTGVRAADGALLPIHARTICIHSDSPGAIDIITAVRAALHKAGIAIRPLGHC